jgi:hypothetical protein
LLVDLAMVVTQLASTITLTTLVFLILPACSTKQKILMLGNALTLMFAEIAMVLLLLRDKAA